MATFRDADPLKAISNLDLKKYFSIVNRVQSGSHISNDEASYLMQHIPHGEEELQALNEKIEKAKVSGIVDKDLNADAALEAARVFMQSPEYKEQMSGMIADAEAGKLGDKITNAFNIALAGGDIATAIRQKTTAQNLANQNVKPGRPGPIVTDQNLAQALRKAQQGTFDVSRQLAPAQAAANDQYNADINNARTASTGQAGAYGAYTQVAANRRNRAGLEQSALGSQIMQQNRANENQLLGLKQQENHNIFQSQAATYPYDLQNYQLQQQTAANLGQYGNQNLRVGLGTLGQGLVNSAYDTARQRKLQALHSMMSQYDQGDAATKAHQDLQNIYDYQGRAEQAYA